MNIKTLLFLSTYGKKFIGHMQLISGLKGNPLSPEILSIYNEANGTSKLLTYMLDNLHGKYIVH